jgi:type IV pilus assembly protein PilC
LPISVKRIPAMIFEWKGINSKGRTLKGEIEAESSDHIRKTLQRKKITPVRIRKKPKNLFENIEFLQTGVSEKELIIFARQFSTMIDAGLPLLQCLEILYTQQPKPTFKKVLKKVKESVESGETFANSLKKFPKVFNELFINMIAAGEAGGILDIILNRLSSHMEKMAKLKSRIKGAMVYPAITILVSIVVIAIIFIFVIPVFTEMFNSFGGTLPTPTLAVIAISDFFILNTGYILGIILAISLILRKVYKRPKGRIILDGLLLKIPLTGLLIIKFSVARFTRTAGTMLSSGVSILEVLDIVAKTSGNKIIELALQDVRSDISEGRLMADSLIETGVFPTMVCSMIAVGESTGALDTMMEKIADFYDNELDQTVQTLTDMIEPLMLVFLGIIIGGIVIAMYLPIFTMAGGL